MNMMLRDCPIHDTIVKVTVNKNPSIKISLSNNNFCQGLTSTLTAIGTTLVSYSWSNLQTINPIIVTPPAGNNIYSVTGTDSKGCKSSGDTTVLVYALPTITVNSPSICTGSSIALTAGGAGATGTYSWSPAAGLSATTGATVTANPASTKVYTVTGKDVNGCQNTATSTVTVNPLPTIIIKPSPASICAGCQQF